MNPSFLLLALLMSQTPATPDAASPLPEDDPVLAAGISKALATRRADKIHRLEYQLDFDLSEGMSHAEGALRVLFACSRPDEDLVLDWDGDAPTEFTFNGRALAGDALRRVANHIVIPAALVVRGRNTLTTKFRSRVAQTGTPLTAYRDEADGKHYYYTLVVPADCHRLFPCFDQPNVKGRLALTLSVPRDWEAACNDVQIGEAELLPGARKRLRFDGRHPLPSYLYAFAAGPFARVRGPAMRFASEPNVERTMDILVRPGKRDAMQAERIAQMHVDSLRWYEAKFSRPYPFSKLELVLCPGFPYGGMEHAGAIFYRESALVFDHAPTKSELLRRSTLIYHEVAHQWFGNLVTMPWFDELWLKEGFATWASYAALHELEPASRAWLRFHQSIKPAALSVDASQGTVPVFQSLGNLAHAKSAYGPIVYNKAPAVLRELEQRLGSAVFYAGVAKFLEDYAYGNASWQMLVACLESAGARDLDRWSRRWIASPGMPRVRPELALGEDGRVQRALLRQSSAQNWMTEAWPLQLELLVRRESGVERHAVQLDGDAMRIEALEGAAAPQWLLLNSTDAAYGLFLPDAASLEALPRALRERDPELEDKLLRALAFRCLEDAMREALLDPRVYLEVALAELERERDPLGFARILSSVEVAIGRYLGGVERAQRRARLATVLRAVLTDGLAQEIELLALRSLARAATSEEDLALLAQVARGEREVAGLELGTQDRFLCAAALLAAGDASLLDELRETSSGDFAKYEYQARAAAPSPSAKAEVFASYMRETDPPEQWIRGSLDFFHWPGQSEATLPYLRKALDAVLWVKEKRKIFFMPAWLDAFINGHASARAARIVDDFLQAESDLPIDVQRKIQQSLDELRRSVRVKKAFPPRD